jgi:hypothetical protein
MPGESVGKFDTPALNGFARRGKYLFHCIFSAWHDSCFQTFPGPVQELTKMSPAEQRHERLLLFCVPMLIVLLGCGASLLPPATLTAALACLTVWAGLSVPLAVLVGHCALGED